MHLLAFALLSAAQPEIIREKLAVLDLEPRGVDKVLATNVSSVVVGAVRKTKRYEVISRDDIEKMLKFEESKQAAGQSANSMAIAAMGETLGFAKMLHGSLGKIGESYVLSLSLIDTKDVHVLASETITAKEDALVTAAGRAVQALFEQLDKAKQ